LGLEDSPAISKPAMVIMVILPISMGLPAIGFSMKIFVVSATYAFLKLLPSKIEINKTINLCGDSNLQESVSKKRKISLCSLQCSNMQY